MTLPPRWTALVLAVALAAPAPADDKPDAKGKLDNNQDKLVSLGTARGTLINPGSDKGNLTIRVSLRYLEPNQQAQANLLQRQQNLLQQQALIMRTRNPFVRQQLLAQLASQARQQPQNLFTVREIQKDFELTPGPDMKVRVLQLPLDFDEKGKPKKYTAKELKELKGDPKLPGYTAEPDSLRANQTVLVYLVGKKKPAPKKGEELDKDALEDNKPIIRMIVILAEPKE
jgi:hypothetical protein